MKTMRNEIAELTFNEKESTLHIKMLEGAVLNEQTVVTHSAQMQQITANKPYVALIDSTHFFGMDPASLQYNAVSDKLSNRIAAAYYNPNLANRFSVEVFRKSNLPFPVEIFKTKHEAEQWLKTKLKAHRQFVK